MLYSHLPLNTPTTPQARARLRAEGVRPGVPDYVIVERSTGRVIWIELKRSNGSLKDLSDAQEEWLHALSNAFVCFGAKYAIQAVKTWLAAC